MKPTVKTDVIKDLWETVMLFAPIKPGPQLSGNSCFHVDTIKTKFEGEEIVIWRYTRTKLKNGKGRIGEMKYDITSPPSNRKKHIAQLIRRIHDKMPKRLEAAPKLLELPPAS